MLGVRASMRSKKSLTLVVSESINFHRDLSEGRSAQHDAGLADGSRSPVPRSSASRSAAMVAERQSQTASPAGGGVDVRGEVAAEEGHAVALQSGCTAKLSRGMS